MVKIGVVLTAACLLFAFSPMTSLAEEAAQETALKVAAINGKTLVKIYPATTWTDLTLGQVVHLKDTIKTDLCDLHSKGEKFVDEKGNVCKLCGSVTLELPDKSSVSLKPGSEMTIDELVMDNAARKLKVNLSKGDLRMIITKVNTPSDFSVKTPNAVYGATGTTFYVNVTATGTSVYVADGSIVVVNPITGATYTVVAGSVMTFNPDGTVVGPAPATDIDVSNWTAYYADPIAEPYTPPLVNQNNLNPPENTLEQGVSGG
ncbi:MAG: FecR family protein [Candidatus Omnitrophica bacterium]|nr:FecR family protein [Candidatus Omnitrophota bacterium]